MVGIITVCVLGFIGQLAVRPEQWLALAARLYDLTLHATYWTLLTSPFLHSSILHLVGNMYYLCVVDDNVEDARDHGRTCF